MKKNKDLDTNGLNEIIHLSKNLLRVFYVIIIVGIILGVLLAFKQLKIFNLLGSILKVLSPLFIGFIISWLVYPLHRKMVDKGFNRILSALIIFLGIIGLGSLFIYIFIPVLYSQVNDLISYVPSVLDNVTTFISRNLDKVVIRGIDIKSIKESIILAGKDYIVNFTSSLPNSIVSIVGSIFSGLGTILFGLVIGIYMLIDFDNIITAFHRILPEKNNQSLRNLFSNIEVNARRVVNGTLLIALMVFVCDFIGFVAIGLNSALLFAFFCGLTDLIPFIGPYIGGAAAVIVGFTQSPIIGIGVLIVAIIVQLLENYVLQPLVMSKAMQLNPITIIVGLLLFGYFFGILGMILATPCIAIIKEVIIFLKEKKNYKPSVIIEENNIKN